MADDTEPTFEVDVSSRPILVLIHGRANFLNCSPLRSFFRRMLDRGAENFLLDFSDCTGMDSTFLGILAGAALDIKRKKPAGEIQLAGLGNRNLELVRNLGLHRIVTLVEKPPAIVSDTGKTEGLSSEELTEQQKKEMLIGAHEDLVEIDEENLSKFQDLLTFLKNED